MPQRALGPFSVSAIGLGCMNLDHGYGPAVSAGQGAQLVQAALDAGVDFFDTAALYGFGANETRLAPLLKPHRHRITLASKCGMQGVDRGDGTRVREINGRPDVLRQTCEDSLRRLQTDVIDLYYLHRWDPRVPIEDSVGALGELVRRGLIRSVGLSEVSAPTLRRAHAEFPITALQSEYSLWTRNPEIAVLDTCRELGVAFVPFSPLGRGFLGGALPSVESLGTLGPTDMRRTLPRFDPAGNYPRNLRLLDALRALGAELGATPAQLALAWLLHKDPGFVPIPGTTRVDHLQDCLGALRLQLSPEAMDRLDALFPPEAIQGNRYAPQGASEVDTERFGFEGPVAR
ncbi:MAG: aldo/keto reductase [Burkholderiaceae bacterium]|nr:aldo/keto reductase [Burkholderiaceae bacterium]